MSIKYKIFLPLALISLVAAGCNKSQPANNATQSSSSQSSSQQSQTPAAGEVVSYTGSGFSPQTLTVLQGSTVVFKNDSSSDVHVASNPHPLHNGYPTTGGCVSSTFDSCANIAPGQSWSFKFDIVGSWGYHNHLNPSQGGTIVVQATSAQAPVTAPAAKSAPVSSMPAHKIFTVTANDNSATLTSISVNKGDAVSIKFSVDANDTYHGGLDFRSANFNTGTITPGSSKTIDFTATDSFVFTPYWPASNIQKPYTVKVNVQ